jgi:hypothetical protein
VLERKAPPTFDVIIELLDYDRLAVHHNVQKTVDLVLRGQAPRPEIRVRISKGNFEIVQEERTLEVDDASSNKSFPSLGKSSKEVAPSEPSNQKIVRVFPYGIARTRLERAIQEKNAPAIVTSDIDSADAVLAIRSTVQNKPRKIRELAGRNVRTIVVRSNTFSNIAGALEEALKANGVGTSEQQEDPALAEVLQAIDTVQQSGRPFELRPQSAQVRKIQFKLIEARRLASEAVGEDPNRRIRILPTKL